MREWDIYNEIIALGKRRGTLTFDEINDAFPSEFFSPDEMEEFMNLLQDMGVKVIDKQEHVTDGEEELEREERGEYERTDNLVQTYFHSVGDSSILTRDEEKELARMIKEGEAIIRSVVTRMPLYTALKGTPKNGNGEGLNHGEEDITDEYFEESFRIIDEIVFGKENRRALGDTGMDLRTLTTQYDRITRARRLVSEAKNEMIIRNLRLVVSIAKHYMGRGLSLLDLIQEGNIGLMKAIGKYDYTRGVKLSTYATWWIRQGISRALMDQAKTIRVPVHMMESYNKVAKASKELISQIGREASKEEIAEKLGVPTKKVEDIFRAIQNPIALQAPVGYNDTFEVFLEDKDSSSPSSNAEQNEITEKILEILDTLTPRETQVIKMRFGIGVEKGNTLEEMGKHFAITRERVRQIEEKALRKLKHPSRLKALRVLNTA